MRAGQLRHRVTIQRPTRTPNSVGEQVITWADHQSFYCQITPVTARETMRSRQPLVDCDHIISARYGVRAWLQNDYRLKYAVGGSTRYFNITGITNVGERNVEIEIRATETTDA